MLLYYDKTYYFYIKITRVTMSKKRRKRIGCKKYFGQKDLL